jgi:hypothetical protein
MFRPSLLICPYIRFVSRSCVIEMARFNKTCQQTHQACWPNFYAIISRNLNIHISDPCPIRVYTRRTMNKEALDSSFILFNEVRNPPFSECWGCTGHNRNWYWSGTQLYWFLRLLVALSRICSTLTFKSFTVFERVFESIASLESKTFEVQSVPTGGTQLKKCMPQGSCFGEMTPRIVIKQDALCLVPNRSLVTVNIFCDN